jgi:hypothetical protein
VAYHATPLLSWGTPAPSYSFLLADSATQAARIIGQDEAVHVPSEQVARETLKLLGLDAEVIEDRIHHAKTGRTLLSR